MGTRSQARTERSETGRSNRVTSAEVAAHAQVSRSAVSRAFTPGASVSDETRERVLVAARELGYRPNAIARSLISGRSRMIGLLAAYLDNQFYPIVIERLARALQDKGYHTLLFIGEAGDQDRQLEQLLAYQVDAVVMASATLSSALAHECHRADIPVVLFNRTVADSPASSVTSDNADGGRQIADLLIDGGHQRIAYIAGDEDSSTNREREHGFCQRLHERGMALHARATGGYVAERAVAATRELMGQASAPDAIFVANDHMAFAVMDTLRGELGLSVPEDVSVASFDGVPQAAWGAYDLTTAAQPVDALVAATVDALFAKLEGGGTQPVVHQVPIELQVRSSTRPVLNVASLSKE